MASRALLDNGLLDRNPGECASNLMTANVRPGSSLRLSLWGRSAARKLGQESSLPVGEGLTGPRSNALIRRYTQWYTVHPR
ncbi:MAG: hypothetical protein H7837_07100 [Magnetococcus sp. MYC-9]